jgi:hypothetical protein
MNIVLSIHSILRWIVVLVALIALVKFLVGWLGRRSHGPADRALLRAFAGILDLQILLGLILLVGLGVERFRLEHAATMLLAAVVAHVVPRLRAGDDAARLRNYAAAVLGALLLVAIGVSALPQGWLG